MKRWLAIAVITSVGVGGCSQTPVEPQQTWVPQFEHVALMDFIRWVQNITGKTFVIAPNITGDITILNSKPMSQTEIYQLLVATLAAQGINVVEADGIVKIFPRQNFDDKQ